MGQQQRRRVSSVSLAESLRSEERREEAQLKPVLEAQLDSNLVSDSVSSVSGDKARDSTSSCEGTENESIDVDARFVSTGDFDHVV